MTTFIFTGDMLVMLFMIMVVAWVSIYASPETLEHSAQIPLTDEKIVESGISLSRDHEERVDSKQGTRTGGRT